LLKILEGAEKRVLKEQMGKERGRTRKKRETEGILKIPFF